MRSRRWISLALLLSCCGRSDEVVDHVRSWLPSQPPRIGDPLITPGISETCLYRSQPSVVRALDLDDLSLDPLDPLATVFAMPRPGAGGAITKLESEFEARPDFRASAIVKARIVVVKARSDLLRWIRDRLAAPNEPAHQDRANGNSIRICPHVRIRGITSRS